MPRSLRVPCAAAVAVAILVAGALLAGPPASACTTEVEGGCAGWSPVPPLPAEGEYELIGDLPTSGGVALALWNGGPAGAIALEAERRGCAVSAVYANDPGGGLTLVPHYWSWSMPSLPASSPVLVECAPRLAGRVLDADGQPLGGVEVIAFDVVNMSGGGAETATDGSFAFGPSVQGRFVLDVFLGYDDSRTRSRIGWYGPDGFTTEREKATEVTVGPAGVEAEIRLPVMAGITGAVLGPDGAPRSEVIVEAEGRGWLSSRGATASDGAFAVPVVAGERVVLAVYAPVPAGDSGGGASDDLHWNIIGWYGAGGFTVKRKEAAAVVSGGPGSEDVEIRFPAVRTVGGVVRGPDGEPRSATVEAHNGDIIRYVSTTPDGSFSVAMPTGQIKLAVRVGGDRVGWYGPGGYTLWRWQAISVPLFDTDIADLEVRLPSVHSMWITLRRPDASSLPYGRLWAYVGDGRWEYMTSVYFGHTAQRDGKYRVLIADGVYALDLGIYDPAWTPVAVHDVESGVTWACGPLVPFEVDGADVTGVEITLPGVAREGYDCR